MWQLATVCDSYRLCVTVRIWNFKICLSGVFCCVLIYSRLLRAKQSLESIETQQKAPEKHILKFKFRGWSKRQIEHFFFMIDLCGWRLGWISIFMVFSCYFYCIVVCLMVLCVYNNQVLLSQSLHSSHTRGLTPVSYVRRSLSPPHSPPHLLHVLHTGFSQWPLPLVLGQLRADGPVYQITDLSPQFITTPPVTCRVIDWFFFEGHF